MPSNSNQKIVSSYNEWDPLEEVIVGSVIGAAHMAFEPSISAFYPLGITKRDFGGNKYSEREIEEAEKQLNNLAKILEDEGVIVRRPDIVEHCTAVKTPDFEIPCGNSNACPRDVLMVIGNEIIEAPMAQRARFFEYRAYRNLIKDYFKKGAKWSAAPKPLMSDKLYVPNHSVEESFFDVDTNPALTNYEPCFDAASFIRFGRDIFCQLDLVTNEFGMQWLQKHLGCDYRIHKIKFADKHPPMHIDTTLVPIRPGLVLVNPERPCSDNTLNLFRDNQWEIIQAPPSIKGLEFYSAEVSNWISMNILNIDQERVIVEEREEPMIRLLESLGCKVITCAFSNVYKFGGGFHCCTLDIRRRGKLQSYFPSLDTIEGTK